jgi:hypothetical protein
MEHSPGDWLLVCADNHPARNAALLAVDQFRCKCIVGCNETHSAEAFYYEHGWMDGPLDPRVYYPEIATSQADNPAARGAGCTGEAQEKNLQLVTANMMAAAQMAHLYVLWGMEAKKLDKSTKPHLSHHNFSVLGQVGCHLIKDTSQNLPK